MSDSNQHSKHFLTFGQSWYFAQGDDNESTTFESKANFVEHCDQIMRTLNVICQGVHKITHAACTVLTLLIYIYIYISES